MTTLDTPTLLDTGTWSGLVFDGRWRQAEGGDAPVVEPATGDELARIGVASAGDVAASCAAAAEAQREWARTSHEERAAVLRRAGDLFVTHAEEIEGWIMRESGGIPPKAQLETHVAQQECWEAAVAAVAPVGRAAGHRQAAPVDVAPAPGRRRRRDLAVQLPADPRHPLGRPGARARQRGRAQARPAHRGVRRRVDRARVRGGRAARRRAARPARRRRGRPGAGRGARGAGHLLHRLDRRGPQGRRGRRQAAQARPPRAGRQQRDDRARGRRPRRRGQRRRVRLLHPPGPGLHDHRPPHRRRRDRRRVRDAPRREGGSHLPVGDPSREQVALGPIIDEGQRDNIHRLVTA